MVWNRNKTRSSGIYRPFIGVRRLSSLKRERRSRFQLGLTPFFVKGLVQRCLGPGFLADRLAELSPELSLRQEIAQEGRMEKKTRIG